MATKDIQTLTADEAAEVVRKIVRRKGKVDIEKIEESFRRTVSSTGVKLDRMLNQALDSLKEKGKIKQNRSKKHPEYSPV